MVPYESLQCWVILYGPIWSTMVLYGPPWTLIVSHGPVWSSLVPQYPGRLPMKFKGSQLLLWSTLVLYGPSWSTMVPYKHWGSPRVHFNLQKGQNKNREKGRKNLKWKISRDKKVIKNLMLHKLTHLCTNFVLVYMLLYLKERILDKAM